MFTLAAGPDAAEAEHRFQAGQVAYDLGRFEDALKHYTAAYQLNQDPAILFTLGECHRQLGNWEQAKFFYGRYLGSAPNVPYAPLVKELLKEMTAKIAAQRASSNKIEPPADAPLKPAGDGTSGIPARPMAADAVASAPQAPTAPPVYRTWWFWTAIGVVAAGSAAAWFVFRPRPRTPTFGTIDADG